MKIGILGSGVVGVTLAKGFLNEGHDVAIATRNPDGDKGAQLKSDVSGAKVTDFALAAAFGDLVILCVLSSAVGEALDAAGADNLKGKVLLDTTNVIRMEGNILRYGGGEQSEAEKIQSKVPDTQVVKAFNTVGVTEMYKPDFGSTKPTMFIAGNDSAAKAAASSIVTAFGWEALDCGDIVAARLLEPMAIIWINTAMGTKNPHHAYKML